MAAEYIIGLGSATDPMALKLETRKRTWINNVMRPETPLKTMLGRIREMKRLHDSCEPVSASSVYNCYGLVFAARRTSIVDDSDVAVVLKEDEYHRLPWDPHAWLPGDVVIYRNKGGQIVHSGIIVKKAVSLTAEDVDVRVLSAWGDYGEYLHSLNDVPELYGRATEVVSQRFLSYVS